MNNYNQNDESRNGNIKGKGLYESLVNSLQTIFRNRKQFFEKNTENPNLDRYLNMMTDGIVSRVMNPEPLPRTPLDDVIDNSINMTMEIALRK